MRDLENQTGKIMPIRLKGDAEAAAFLGCHAKTIKKMRMLGKIPYLKIGRAYFFSPSELIKTFQHNAL